jgi:hypothetical protein
MALVDQMPDVFKVDGVDEPGQTTVHVFASANTPFDPEKPIGFRDITDGTSNTILAVVAGPETAGPSPAVWRSIPLTRSALLEQLYSRPCSVMELSRMFPPVFPRSF